MSFKLLTEHNLELLSLTGGCTGLFESTLVKLPHCWKSHVTAQLFSFQQSASHAILKTDGIQIGEHTISVAISNPPGRKTPLAKREESSFVPSLGGGKKETSR